MEERKDSVTYTESETPGAASSKSAETLAAAPKARDFAKMENTKITTTPDTIPIKAGEGGTNTNPSTSTRMWKRFKVKAFSGMQAMGGRTRGLTA